MNVRNFIGASSAVLLAWLGATYLHEVPSERYPKQERLSSTAPVEMETENDEMIASNDSPIPGDR